MVTACVDIEKCKGEEDDDDNNNSGDGGESNTYKENNGHVACSNCNNCIVHNQWINFNIMYA